MIPTAAMAVPRSAGMPPGAASACQNASAGLTTLTVVPPNRPQSRALQSAKMPRAAVSARVTASSTEVRVNAAAGVRTGASERPRMASACQNVKSIEVCAINLPSRFSIKLLIKITSLNS